MFTCQTRGLGLQAQDQLGRVFTHNHTRICHEALRVKTQSWMLSIYLSTYLLIYTYIYTH
jgi:hypothetical protein